MNKFNTVLYSLFQAKLEEKHAEAAELSNKYQHSQVKIIMNQYCHFKTLYFT